MITGAVRDLYIARWGEPSRNARFQVDGLEVEIFKWSAEINPEGVNLYVTIGASAQPLTGRDTGHRVEFFTGLLPARDEIASPLAALALYSAREGVALDHGHTVPAGRPLWPGTDMRWFMVLQPVEDVIAPLVLSDGAHVDFLQAIPIFKSELAYKKEQGAEALLALWEAGQVPFWDPGRSPVPALR